MAHNVINIVRKDFARNYRQRGILADVNQLLYDFFILEKDFDFLNIIKTNVLEPESNTEVIFLILEFYYNHIPYKDSFFIKKSILKII